MMKRLSKFLVVLAAVSLSIMGPYSAAAQNDQTCPLQSKTLKAFLVEKEFTAEVGQEVLIDIRLDPSKPPAGFFITSLVDVLESPPDAKPSILTGFPQISLKLDQPGDYVMEVRVNLVAKSSCGGVKAATLLTEKVKIKIVNSQ